MFGSFHLFAKSHSYSFPFPLLPEKRGQRNFSIIVFSTAGNFIKFGALIPESTVDTTAVVFPTKLV